MSTLDRFSPLPPYETIEFIDIFANDSLNRPLPEIEDSTEDEHPKDEHAELPPLHTVDLVTYYEHRTQQTPETSRSHCTEFNATGQHYEQVPTLPTLFNEVDMMLRNPWKSVPGIMMDDHPDEEMKVDYADVEHDDEPIAVLAELVHPEYCHRPEHHYWAPDMGDIVPLDPDTMLPIVSCSAKKPVQSMAPSPADAQQEV